MKGLRLYDQKGAAAVEFAIICPLLILLLFAVVEWGLYMFNRQIITNACREGARAGIVARPVRVSDDEIRQIVHAYADAHLVTFGDDHEFHITPGPPDRCLTFGCPLEVTGVYRYEFLFLRTIPGFNAVLPIEAVARMRME